MPRTIRNLNDYIAEIKEGEDRYLAIRTRLPGRIFAVTNLGELKKEPGWIWKDGHIEPWNILGFAEAEGEMYIYGPWLNGIGFRELVKEDDSHVRQLMEDLSDFFEIAEQRQIPLYRFSLDQYFRIDDGRLLIFPPRLMKHLMENKTEEERMIIEEPFNHPEMEGKQALGFTLAVLAYRAACGEFPYAEAEDAADIHDRMRSLSILSPREKKPQIKSSVSDSIMKGLHPEEEMLTGKPLFITENKWIEEVEPETAEKALAAAYQKEKKAKQQFLRIRFIRKHRIQLMLGAVGLLVVIFGSIRLLNQEPSELIGKQPIEVVETYYQKLMEMDVSGAEECTDGDTGTNDVDELSNYFVISRVRMGYEGTTGFIPAQIWRDGGSPEVTFPESVYGIAELELSQTDDTTFTAVYEKWIPDTVPDETVNGDPAFFSGAIITDTLTMTPHKDGYLVIDTIERETEPIEP